MPTMYAELLRLVRLVNSRQERTLEETQLMQLLQASMQVLLVVHTRFNSPAFKLTLVLCGPLRMVLCGPLLMVLCGPLHMVLCGSLLMSMV